MTLCNSDWVLRDACGTDLDALVTLETASFESDRLSRRSFRYHLQHESSLVLVGVAAGEIVAYALVFMRVGTSLARLYSIAVDQRCGGRGIGRQLVESVEARAAEQGRMFMRLEVRPDNISAIKLYEGLGYRRFGIYRDYYDDHADALRFEKRILPKQRRQAHQRQHPVPYYEQTTEFTCGAAALMMVMRQLDATSALDQRTELQIWREATTIFMTAGHGGCGPHGLAYAAARRGLSASVHVSQSGPLFVEGVRSQAKKDVLALVHADFMEKLAALAVPVHEQAPTMGLLRDAVAQDILPIVLISTYRLDGRKAPHWVVLVDMDDQFAYIHDPDKVEAKAEGVANAALDSQYVPIACDSFERMLQFGQTRLRCVVLVQQPATSEQVTPKRKR